MKLNDELKERVEAAKAYVRRFDELAIPHRNYCRTVEELYSAAALSSGDDLVCLVGPSRVGKTKAISTVIEMLKPPSSNEDAMFRPVVYLGASNDGNNGTFNTKSFDIRLIESTGNPVYCAILEQNKKVSGHVFIDRLNPAKRASAVKQSLIGCGCRWLIIDEAHHIRYVASNPARAVQVFDQLKQLAQSIGVTLILVGAYPLLNAMEYSPHLSARKIQIHFSRYTTSKEDLVEFRDAVKYYADLLPVDLKVWRKMVPLLFEHSLGCIGLLRRNFKTIVASSTALNVPIDEKLIAQSLVATTDLQSLRTEIEAGEQYLGLNPLLLGSDTAVSRSTSSTDDSKKKTNKKPFQRKNDRMKPGNRVEE